MLGRKSLSDAQKYSDKIHFLRVERYGNNIEYDVEKC